MTSSSPPFRQPGPLGLPNFVGYNQLVASSEELLQLAGFAADWKDWGAVAARLADRELFGKAAEACAVGLRSGLNADLLASLVGNLEKLGLTHEALTHLYDLHSLDPARPGTKDWLVRLSLLAGRPDIAVQFITDVPATLAWLRPQLQPAKEPALQFGYAFLLYYGGRYRDAVAQFQPLQSMADWAIWAHSMAGLCHYRLGERVDRRGPGVDWQGGRRRSGHVGGQNAP